MRGLTVAILIVGMGALIPLSPAQARTRAFVAKPSRITCMASSLGEKAATVRCDLPFIGRRAVFLRTRGKARIRRVSDFLHPARRSVLGRGAQLHLGQFTCTSLRAAVNCRSGNGHGFTVGRQFQLIF